MSENARSRFEILLQRYFDKTLTNEEADELVALWDSDPLYGDVAEENLFVHHAFRFFGDLERKPIFYGSTTTDNSVAENNARKIGLTPTGSPFENEDKILFPHLRDLDILELLAAETRNCPATIKPIVEHPSLTSPSSLKDGNGDTIPSSRRNPVKPFDKNASSSWIPWKILAPLLLFLFGLGVYFEFRPSPPLEEPDLFGSFPARIVEAIDTDFSEGVSPFKKDRQLEPGPIELLAGLLEIEYKNGVRVVLEGPVKYHVETAMESACDLGKLSVYVPPEGKGFSVTTPRMTVRDLGTAFFLDVGPDNTELHVIEGEVEANWLTRDWLPFKAGRGVERREGKDVRNFVAEPKLFVSEKEVRQKKNEYTAHRQPVWTEQRKRLLNDASLIWHLEPDMVSPRAKTTGSRDDKTAFFFRKAGDRVEASIRSECRDLTLLASVRLDELHRHPNTLIVGHGFQRTPGELHWQIDCFGVLQFYLHYGTLDTRSFLSPVVLSPKDCRTWIALAVVADSRQKTITHYLDGRAVAALPWTPIPIRLDRLTIGNERASGKTVTNRYFKGSLEDFLIFDRPFSPEEIENHYRNNR